MVFLCHIRSICCGCIGRRLPKNRDQLDQDIWRRSWDEKSSNVGILIGAVILLLTLVVTIHSFYICALDPIFMRLIHYMTGPGSFSSQHSAIGDGFLSITNVAFLLVIILTLATYKCFGLFLSTIITTLSVFSVFNCFQVGRKTVLDIVIPQIVQFMDQVKSDEELQHVINVKIGLEKSNPKSKVTTDGEKPDDFDLESQESHDKHE
jgi:hypothetical protein